MTPSRTSEPQVALYAAAGSNRGGTGVYTRRLIWGFQLLGADNVVPLSPNSGGILRKLLSENVTIPGKLRNSSFSLLHLPAFGGSVPGGIPYVVTVHDMAFMRHPEWFGPLRRLYYRMKFPRIAKGAAAVIADSDFTSAEIRDLLGIHSTRVYLSASPSQISCDPFRKKTGISGEYILYTGTVEPRKNIAALLEAWHTIRSARPGLILVITGRWGWGAAELRDALQSTKGVLWTGPVSDRMIGSAMAGARLLVYPSLYEGFGLPPLEAAAAGTPSVIGPAEALAEIFGSICAGTSRSDAGSISEAVLNALESRVSPDDLKDFASEFSLQRTAGETLDCYREAAR